jgi:hypothetical protein
LVGSEVPNSPKEYNKNDFEIKARPHPFLGVYGHSLFEDVLTPGTLAILIAQVYVILSEEDCFDDAVAHGNKDDSED